MTEVNSAAAAAARRGWVPRLNLWHLSVLVMFAAIVIRNIQDQRMTEPALVALAMIGFLGYGILGAIGWKATRRLEPTIGRTAGLATYLVLMGLLFLSATWIYLILEYYYRNG